MRIHLFYLLFCSILLAARATPVLNVEAMNGWTTGEAPQEEVSRLRSIGGEFIDISMSEESGVVAVVVQYPPTPIDHHAAAGVIDAYKEHVEGVAGTMDPVYRTKVGKFHAYRITIKVDNIYSLTFAIFTSEHIVIVTLQREGSLNPDDPAVIAYLSRLRFMDGISPGRIDAIDRESTSYWLGYFALPLLLIGLPILIFVIRRIIWRRIKVKSAQPSATDNPDDAQRIRKD